MMISLEIDEAHSTPDLGIYLEAMQNFPFASSFLTEKPYDLEDRVAS